MTAAVEVQTVTVKGTAVRSVMKFLEKELTREQLEQALDTLPAETARKFRAGILATAQLPVSVVNQLTTAAAKAKGEPVEMFANRAGRFAADDAVKTVYKLLVMVLTPTSLLQKATGMWRTIYSAGSFTVEAKSPTESHIVLKDFPSETVGCARVTGWMQQLGEMTKAKNLRISHIRCMARKDPQCEWTVIWGQ